MTTIRYLVSLLVLCAGPCFLTAQEETPSKHQPIKHENIEWKWVRGHDGNAGNEEADALANLAIDEL